MSPAPTGEVSTPGSPATADEAGQKLAPGRIVAAIIFALAAIAFLVVAATYMVTPSRSLPGFMEPSNSGVHHTLRGVGTLLVGAAFAAGAWFALRYRSATLEE